MKCVLVLMLMGAGGPFGQSLAAGLRRAEASETERLPTTKSHPHVLVCLDPGDGASARECDREVGMEIRDAL